MQQQERSDAEDGCTCRRRDPGDVRLRLQFNCPVDVNWAFMDGRLLQRFWERHPEERVAAAPICDHILVCMRGITTVRAPFWLYTLPRAQSAAQ